MLQLLASILLLSTESNAFNEPNPPTWPSNIVVNPTQSQIDSIYTEMGGHQPAFNGQWSNSRYALLFAPGSYTDLTINVGFYTQIMGMGKKPTDVKLGNVICENGDFDYTGGALDNFWRSIENFETTPTTTWTNNLSMLWAVSQASPIRRIQVNGNLQLWQYNSGCCAGYASGGYLSDSIVTGQISSGSQQQWITRNTNMGSWTGGVWNMVYVGCNGAPATHCSDQGGSPYTTEGAVKFIAEKPYIYYDGSKYHLQIPSVERNKMGATSNYGANDLSVDFSNVYVTNAKTDTAATINAKIQSGINYIVLTGGNYNFAEPIMLTKSNQTILGLGFPTLTPTNGNALIQVASNIDGVRIAGVLLQAGKVKSTTLLQVGTPNAKKGYQYDQTNPTILYDIFARVGGTNDPSQYQVSADSMVAIYNDYTILDDAWLWRADHDVSGSVTNSQNPVATGLIVGGNGVTTYGLAAEHTLGNLVEWYGNNGAAYFYQSEFPYDVTQANYGSKGYAGFLVNSTVTSFNGYGIGVYCYFRDNTVTVQNGIKTPTGSGINMVDSLSVFLNGNGAIEHVIDNQGAPVEAIGQQAYVCKL